MLSSGGLTFGGDAGRKPRRQQPWSVGGSRGSRRGRAWPSQGWRRTDRVDDRPLRAPPQAPTRSLVGFGAGRHTAPASTPGPRGGKVRWSAALGRERVARGEARVCGRLVLGPAGHSPCRSRVSRAPGKVYKRQKVSEEHDRTQTHCVRVQVQVHRTAPRPQPPRPACVSCPAAPGPRGRAAPWAGTVRPAKPGGATLCPRPGSARPALNHAVLAVLAGLCSHRQTRTDDSHCAR